MYLDYWQLSAKPFEPHGGGEFYYPAESHEGAASKLRYAVQQGRAAAALAGPSGTGKTLLIERLAAEGRSNGDGSPVRPVVHVVFPDMSGRDLLAYLSERLGAPAVSESPSGSVEESLRRLEALAERNAEHGTRPLLVIDEAHLLEDSGALETVRLLTNLRSGPGPAFSLLLVGQMGLLSAVARHPTLDERLAVKALVRGLTAQETAAYTHHRLKAAGATRELFTADAMQKLHILSDGQPRRINRLADLALVIGFADSQPQVGPEQLEAVHRELVTLGGD